MSTPPFEGPSSGPGPGDIPEDEVNGQPPILAAQAPEGTNTEHLQEQAENDDPDGMDAGSDGDDNMSDISNQELLAAIEQMSDFDENERLSQLSSGDSLDGVDDGDSDSGSSDLDDDDDSSSSSSGFEVSESSSLSSMESDISTEDDDSDENERRRRRIRYKSREDRLKREEVILEADRLVEKFRMEERIFTRDNLREDMAMPDVVDAQWAIEIIERGRATLRELRALRHLALISGFPFDESSMDVILDEDLHMKRRELGVGNGKVKEEDDADMKPSTSRQNGEGLGIKEEVENDERSAKERRRSGSSKKSRRKNKKARRASSRQSIEIDPEERRRLRKELRKIGRRNVLEKSEADEIHQVLCEPSTSYGGPSTSKAKTRPPKVRDQKAALKELEEDMNEIEEEIRLENTLKNLVDGVGEKPKEEEIKYEFRAFKRRRALRKAMESESEEEDMIANSEESGSEADEYGAGTSKQENVICSDFSSASSLDGSGVEYDDDFDEEEAAANMRLIDIINKKCRRRLAVAHLTRNSYDSTCLKAVETSRKQKHMISVALRRASNVALPWSEFDSQPSPSKYEDSDDEADQSLSATTTQSASPAMDELDSDTKCTVIPISSDAPFVNGHSSPRKRTYQSISPDDCPPTKIPYQPNGRLIPKHDVFEKPSSSHITFREPSIQIMNGHGTPLIGNIGKDGLRDERSGTPPIFDDQNEEEERLVRKMLKIIDRKRKQKEDMEMRVKTVMTNAEVFRANVLSNLADLTAVSSQINGRLSREKELLFEEISTSREHMKLRPNHKVDDRSKEFVSLDWEQRNKIIKEEWDLMVLRKRKAVVEYFDEKITGNEEDTDDERERVEEAEKKKERERRREEEEDEENEEEPKEVPFYAKEEKPFPKIVDRELERRCKRYVIRQQDETKFSKQVRVEDNTEWQLRTFHEKFDKADIKAVRKSARRRNGNNEQENDEREEEEYEGLDDEAKAMVDMVMQQNVVSTSTGVSTRFGGERGGTPRSNVNSPVHSSAHLHTNGPSSTSLENHASPQPTKLSKTPLVGGGGGGTATPGRSTPVTTTGGGGIATTRARRSAAAPAVVNNGGTLKDEERDKENEETEVEKEVETKDELAATDDEPGTSKAPRAQKRPRKSVASNATTPVVAEKKAKKNNHNNANTIAREEVETPTPATRSNSSTIGNGTASTNGGGKRNSARVARASAATKVVSSTASSTQSSSSVLTTTSQNEQDGMPHDPSEPTYCFCSRISFGEMIGCDNEKCDIEWFHFECIGLITKPKGKWYCPNCRHPDSAKMPKSHATATGRTTRQSNHSHA